MCVCVCIYMYVGSMLVVAVSRLANILNWNLSRFSAKYAPQVTHSLRAGSLVTEEINLPP